jgi:hypothetical protein
MYVWYEALASVFCAMQVRSALCAARYATIEYRATAPGAFRANSALGVVA